MNGGAAVHFLFAFQHGPAVGNNDKAAADLDYWNRDPEEIQDMRPDQERSNQEDEAVHRDLAREDSASGGGVFTGQGEEDRAATEGIDDGEEGGKDEQDTFDDFGQRGILRDREYQGDIPSEYEQLG